IGEQGERITQQCGVSSEEGYLAWKETYDVIKKHNALFKRGKSLFKLGLNAYSDL
ncbi:hypothetical protein LSAT2_009169, partial [Lamellibrachia satsuma]